MSRNSKNARNLARARDFSKIRKEGGRSAAKTAPKHNKRWGYRSNPEVQKRIAEMMKATAEATSAREEKTSGKRILRGAGKAAKTDSDE